MNARRNRRHFLRTTAAALATAALPQRAPAAEAQRNELPPVRSITRGPKFHWFGYYDKLQFDPAGRRVLGMEVDFEHRSPKADDVIRVGLVDLKENDRWSELGTSRAWCWQQGCMLQWRPGAKSEVVWNDREGDRFVCRLFDVESGKRRTIPHPIYTLNPDGRTAVSPSFARLNDVRPGYGYAGLPDQYREELAPKDSGIFRIDLDSGKQTLIVSLTDMANVPYARGDLSPAKHWFNHLLFSPDGQRFEFLHRWRLPGQKDFGTRMCTARLDGSDVRVIDPSGRTSHFIWRDPRHILAWSWHESHGDAFYLFEDKAGGKIEVVGKGVMTVNGHCTYLPGNQWILNDTYPDRQRKQNVYLYHVDSGRRVPLGSFELPRTYSGEWRCDTHPRLSPDGRSVVIDSPHTGAGRQMHLIDIGRIVG